MSLVNRCWAVFLRWILGIASGILSLRTRLGKGTSWSGFLGTSTAGFQQQLAMLGKVQSLPHPSGLYPSNNYSHGHGLSTT